MERRAARGTRAHGPSTSILSSFTLRSRTGLATVSPFFFFAHKGVIAARGAERPTRAPAGGWNADANEAHAMTSKRRILWLVALQLSIC